VISSNAHRYPVSALCRCLGIPRSLYYYHRNRIKESSDSDLGNHVKEIFEQNRSVYGCRKIKAMLLRKGMIASKRRICRIMQELGLRPQLGRRKPLVKKTRTNTSDTPNLLARRFDDQGPYDAVVSDLTYVRVGSKWHYVCVLLDLHNREIIGYSAGTRKDAKLVYEAFASVAVPLYKAANVPYRSRE
jgi:putative transposase